MPKRIGELIPTVLREASGNRQTLERLQGRWRRLVGRELAKHSRPSWLRRGRLYVHVDQPAAGFLIGFVKPRILSALSRQAGCEITEMVVRVGEL